MKKIIFLLLTAVLFTVLSGNRQKEGRYKIEAALIEYELDMMGMKAKSFLYFKDYGKHQCIETSMEMMGLKLVNRTLEIAGYTYTLNMNEKTGTKIKTVVNEEEIDPNNMDFENMSDEIKTKYKIVEKGNQDFAGKNCKVFGMTIEGQDASFFVWNNIPLKYEMSQNNMRMIMKAVRIEENPSFPAGIFEIPVDFKIEEIN
jgi:hypothetical protein